MQVTPLLLMIILSSLLSLFLYESSSSSSSVLDALADGLDGALEAGGGLQLQLVGHGVDLEPVQPGERRRRQTYVSISSNHCLGWLTKHDEKSRVVPKLQILTSNEIDRMQHKHVH